MKKQNQVHYWLLHPCVFLRLMPLIYGATHKDGPNIKDWVTKCKSSRIGFHLSCPTGPSCWIGLCVCDFIEWRSGQIADDKWGNGPNGEKKCMSVNMDVSPRHRRWQEGYNVLKWLTVHALFMQSCWSEKERAMERHRQTEKEIKRDKLSAPP